MMDLKTVAIWRLKWKLMAGHIMSAKETLLDIAEKLPPDATLVDAIYELEFRQAVEEGLASLDRGERIPLEEVRKRIPQWISKYSSPATP
jgi:predicted transcriptional regulator